MSEYGIETTPCRRPRDLLVTGADQLPGEALVAVPRLAQAHAGAPAEEAAEVVRLRERTLRPGEETSRL